MDFLDPKKERRNHIALIVSYALVAVAVVIASIVLLYQTDGYCLDDSGAVDRCGLVFLSSEPAGSTISVNGEPVGSRTNTKLNLHSGVYAIQLTRDGYRNWNRTVEVAGGDVQRFDYPFLFPNTLETTNITTYADGLSFVSQSLDKRWLVAAGTTQPGSFTLYDLKKPSKPSSSTETLPSGVYTTGDGAQNWAAVEWSRDNRRVLLLHTYTSAGVAGQEYIMLDRQDIELSQNLTKTLGLTAADQLSLFDKKADEYYVYNAENKTLQTTSTSGSAPTALQLKDVVAFKAYSDNTILYVTGTPPSGKVTKGMVSIVLQQDNRSQVIRQLPSDAPAYLLEITRYSGDWYVAVAASNDKGVRVYKNTFDQKLATSASLPTPIRFLKVENPTHVSFSANTQFILAENGQSCVVYDAEYDDSYSYKTAILDAPQMHLKWMDGNRLYSVSGGKATVADYDAQNMQTLQAADSRYDLFFSSDYAYVFSVAPAAAGVDLTSTALQVQ
jgi:hypothetical protein